ncbi:probable serine carboxypeptidase CPVL [Biomphalaria glabrata]|uniref:Probable serine carboxypeptidase CPVL n=1 Tax=Biomphalaria glabrata TaxID=6526 RepID=A0A9U8E6K2_BIOGL|nr:probable serine carboxypeptidase CPVL [Biomphalaria glabrata]
MLGTLSIFFILCYLLTTIGGFGQEALDLTPYIATNAKLARELSQVRDPRGIIPPSYSGFVNVDRRFGNHLFFWFFPALNSSLTAPLLVWLNGGPTYSSMIGLFQENGPIKVVIKNGTVGYARKERSWAETFSMLYIDNPVGTGFSYTEDERGYKVDQDGYGQDLYSFITNFYKMFPEYLKRPLYIGGTSYAGKYVSAFAYLLDQKIQKRETCIPFAGIYLGAPFYEPFPQVKSSPDLLYNLGVLSRRQRQVYLENITALENKLQDPTNNVSSLEIIGTLNPPLGLTDLNNYHTQQGIQLEIEALMNSEEMKRIVHAGNRTFRLFNADLFLKFNKDFMTSATSKIASLMNRYKVLIYNGDYDLTVSTSSVETALASTPWEGRQDYLSSSRSVWRVNSNLAGYFSRVDKFCRVIVRKSGHLASFDQLEITALMMRQFVETGCVE